MSDVLRNGVLDGIAVCVAGGGGAVAERCTALGARVTRLEAELADEDAVAAAVAAVGDVDVLVCDAGPAFRAAGGGVPGLRAAVDGTWNAVRGVVAARWAVEDAGPGGKVVLLAPAADAGEAADATGAALENAARTLSVEWARFGVRTVALRPAAGAPAETAELVAFLASRGGDYFSGCAFRLV